MAHRRSIVAIGVDNPGARSGLPALRYAERDANAVVELLCDPDVGTFDPKDVTLLTGAAARADQIKAALRRIVLGSDESDVLVLYFAGHTLMPSWSRGTDLYLVTSDFDETVLSENPDAGLRKTFLTRDVLPHFKGTAVLILDCCQAGSLATFQGADLIGVGSRDDLHHNVLAACAANEYAREAAEFEHGIFTHHVLDGLRGRAADSHGSVTFEALSAYVCGQGLDPRPTVLLQARETTLLTNPGDGTQQMVATVPEPETESVQIVPLHNPMDPHVGELTRLVDRLARKARGLFSADGAMAGISRVEFIRSALEADAVAYISHTEVPKHAEGLRRVENGFVAIDATDGFDLDSVRHLLRAADDDVRSPVSPRGFGRMASDAQRQLWCAPLGRDDNRVQLLAVINPPASLVNLGQAGAKVLQAIWHSDIAGSPEESEILVLTALRSAFGRLPDELFERCLHLYRGVLNSLSIVFQPVVTIGKAPRQVGVHSYEALARRSPADQSAPWSLLKLAHTWGDHFVIERDKIILEKALTSYTQAHVDSPWSGDVPKPVSVNVSVRSLLDDSYVELLCQLISRLQLHANAVTLEISERDAIEPWDGEQWREAPHPYFNKRLAAIAREAGVAFALDDFGVGQASLSRMAELPLTHIKVDRAILHHRQAILELELVVAVSRDALDRGETHTPRAVIIEGVDHESPVSLEQIFQTGIRHVQGYITGEQGSADLRGLTPDARKDIAARVRGDDENSPTELARGDSATGGDSVRRSA